MSQLDTANSSWIRRMTYTPLALGVSKQGWKDAKGNDTRVDGFLVVETDEGRRYAWAVPSWCAGLVCAHKSRGRALGLLVKGKYQSVMLTARRHSKPDN